MGKAQSLRNRVRSYWQSRPRTARGPPDRVGRRPGRRRRLHDRSIRSARRCSSRTTSSSATSRASTSGSRTTRATRTSRSPWATTSRASSGRGSSPSDGSRYFGPYASASSVDEAMNLIRRLFPFRTCTIDIKEGERALAAALPPVPHQALPGAVHPGHRQADLPGRHRPGEAFLEGRQETVVRSPAAADDRPPSEELEFERAAALRDKVRAIERTMESQKMAAFARTELDVVGLARQDNEAGGAAVRDPQRQDRSAATCSCSTPAATRPTTRCLAASSSSSTRARRRSRREILRAGRRSRTPTSWRRSCAARRGAAGPPARAAARREARAHGPRAPQRRRDAAARARPLARRPGPDPGGARRSWPTALGLPGAADAHRVLRHQHVPGRRVGRQHGRVRGGPAADRRVPPLSRSGRSRARTTSPATRRCCAAASIGLATARRAAPRSCAGGCRTS